MLTQRAIQGCVRLFLLGRSEQANATSTARRRTSQ